MTQKFGYTHTHTRTQIDRLTLSIIVHGIDTNEVVPMNMFPFLHSRYLI